MKLLLISIYYFFASNNIVVVDVDDMELLSGVKIKTKSFVEYSDFDGRCKIREKIIDVEDVSYEYKYISNDTIFMKKNNSILFGN